MLKSHTINQGNTFMTRKLKLLISIICISTLITTVSAATTKEIETVVLKNATYCHLTANGDYVEGYPSSITAFSDNKEFYLSPGETGKVPLLKNNDEQYIIVDHGDAADRYKFNYTSDDKYILGYEDENTYCSHSYFPPCLTLSKVNPCG